MFFLYQITISLIIFLSPIIFVFRIFNKKEDRKRYIEDRRKIKDKDFYTTDAMKEFRKLFPSTNR